MKKLMKVVGGGILIVLLVLVLVVVLFVNPIIKTGIRKGAPAALGVPVTIEDVDVRPFRGQVALKGFVMGNPEGFKSDSLFRLAELNVKMDMASLLKDTIVINEIQIDAADITYEMGLSGSNIGALMDKLQAGTPEETAPRTSGRKVIIQQLVVSHGKVGVKTTLLGGQGVTLPLPTITLTDIGKEKEGASVAQVVADVMGAIAKAVGATVAASGQLAGDALKGAADLAGKGVGAAAGLAGQGVGAAASLAGQGVGAAASLAGQGVGAAADLAGKGAGATLDVAGEGVGAAAEAVGSAGKALGSGAQKLVGGVGGLFTKQDAEPNTNAADAADAPAE